MCVEPIHAPCEIGGTAVYNTTSSGNHSRYYTFQDVALWLHTCIYMYVHTLDLIIFRRWFIDMMSLSCKWLPGLHVYFHNEYTLGEKLHNNVAKNEPFDQWMSQSVSPVSPSASPGLLRLSWASHQGTACTWEIPQVKPLSDIVQQVYKN